MRRIRVYALHMGFCRIITTRTPSSSSTSSFRIGRQRVVHIGDVDSLQPEEFFLRLLGDLVPGRQRIFAGLGVSVVLDHFRG